MPSEFEERKELIDHQSKRDREFHAMKMEQLAYMRETGNIQHEKELERGRIKSAEIRKMQERKKAGRY